MTPIFWTPEVLFVNREEPENRYGICKACIAWKFYGLT
jgi:hypothetical protein